MKSTIFLCTTIMSLSFLSHGQGKIGIFDNHLDIGNCNIKGAAHFDPTDQTYIISGSGQNMWDTEDQFQFLWTTIQGDFILRTEATFLNPEGDPHRKIGWIVKNDLEDDTKHVNATIHGNGIASLQYRKSDQETTLEIQAAVNAPDVIQLERRGSTFIMSTAKFGEEWTHVELENMDMDTEIYIGIYVCAHNPEVLEKAKFRNVRIVLPVDPDYQPYRDYIGSHLEIMDVETGNRKIIYSSAHSIQAPNWTADGKRLIYNSKGFLYNYNLSDNEITPLNTGFAIDNNNDHVLSFDGAKLGISHHNADENRASTIYYLPTEGHSNPTRVTLPDAGHSYLHGWSPDSKKMIFTGNRKGSYDIYTVDVNSGKEIQLTNQKTVDDGPEYSKDGQHIFFNSARTGTMKLWRMDPDGSNKKQLTFDEYNDWFPHVSPDQKWIVFISFPSDIDPNSHPFYKHCLLRIMPFEGGEAKVIGYLYGGQGTINVPSWSPDSKRIAFVSNSKM